VGEISPTSLVGFFDENARTIEPESLPESGSFFLMP
jgi:hypothetical protein